MEKEPTYNYERQSMPVVKWMRRVGHLMIKAAEKRKQRKLQERQKLNASKQEKEHKRV